MELNKLFLDQLEREVETSRKVLERVPEKRNSWKPHPKSMELGYLAVLVATMPAWAAMMIEKDGLNLGEAGEGFRPKVVETRAELLKLLDESAAKARVALQNASDAHLMKPWKLSMHGHTLSNDPRHVALMNGLFSHMAHHRGQLSVYLRLNDSAVPAMYGPSADERG